MSPHPQPIIVIKKKAAHGGHHGGAWKVAYADFVTAMMALFIVLWLMSANAKVKESISAYFKDPSGASNRTGSATAGTGETLNVAKDDMTDLKDKLEQAMRKNPEFERLKDNVDMTVTGEGLRVELLESERGMFFESGNAKPSGAGEDMLRILALELGKLPNELMLEGHTDARPFAGRMDYSNWELSADRANAARRLMQSSGLRENQVAQVRGFAAQHLRNAKDPDNAANRRISVIVRYLKP